ncbi:MAG: glycosyltransferase family 1 protein [Bacteroidales bacterium]|nr:glycosyltransferase family 1 protein [Bacteroidales bacterium]
MKIAIEAQRIFRKNKHGMDFVACEIIKQLQRIDTENQYYIIVAPGEDVCIKETSNFRIIVVKCPTYPLWEQVALPLAVKRIKPDILHCTSNTAPIFCKTPLVITLHDIIYLEKRQSSSKSIYQNMGWYYRRFVVPRILPKCRKIITVSQFECERIKDALHIDSSRILAIYNGFGEYFKPVRNFLNTTNKYFSAESWLFFLGNTDPKKNTLRTLKAYEIYVKQTEKPLPLVIADLNESIVDQLLNDNGLTSLKPLLISPGYIVNIDLPAIYSGAKIFLYTSLRESFGIPLLEAMACGTPVITSNTSSMPEVAGEGAILINPFDENEIAKMILKLEADDELYKKQVVYGLDRVKSFSWTKTAISTLEVYKSI